MKIRRVNCLKAGSNQNPRRFYRRRRGVETVARRQRQSRRSRLLLRRCIVNYLATQLPFLAAAVPFYGSQPTAEETAKIKTPLLLHYAGEDERINAGWPAYETALKASV